MSFLAAWMLDIVWDTVSSEALTGSSAQTYPHYIWLSNTLPQRLNNLDIIENVDLIETGSGPPGILHLR